MSTIAILGSGIVGQTLAAGLRELGHDVTIGSRNGKAVQGWDGAVGTFTEALAGATVAVLAVKGTVAQEVVESLAADLADVVVLDTTNPMADTAPTDGVLAYFTGPNESLLERLQAAAPDAKFVKAFNSVGSALMVKPALTYLDVLTRARADEAARSTVGEFVRSLGWDVEDLGSAAAARAIEPLCMLWCIPGLRANDWMHAFAVLRP